MLFKYILRSLLIGNIITFISCSSASMLNTKEEKSEMILKTQDNYQFTGIVLENMVHPIIENKKPEIIKVRITSSINKDLQPNNIIYCERGKDNNLIPVVNREYVFKGKNSYITKDNKTYIKEVIIQDLIH